MKKTILNILLLAGACVAPANNVSAQTDSLSYAAGVYAASNITRGMLPQIKSNFEQMGISLDEKTFKEAIIAVINDTNTLINDEQALDMLNSAAEKAYKETIEKNKAKGEKFLAENKTKKDVKTTASGLQYKVLTEGKGETPKESDKVKVHYEGRTLDGTVFDSSYKRNEPTSFGLTQVIKGWTEVLQLMPVGSKWEVYIPQELAYGERGAGKDIKPCEALIFTIELIDIEK